MKMKMNFCAVFWGVFLAAGVAFSGPGGERKKTIYNCTVDQKEQLRTGSKYSRLEVTVVFDDEDQGCQATVIASDEKNNIREEYPRSISCTAGLKKWLSKGNNQVYENACFRYFDQIFVSTDSEGRFSYLVSISGEYKNNGTRVGLDCPISRPIPPKPVGMDCQAQ